MHVKQSVDCMGNAMHIHSNEQQQQQQQNAQIDSDACEIWLAYCGLENFISNFMNFIAQLRKHIFSTAWLK